jgi:hypothetical protein
LVDQRPDVRFPGSFRANEHIQYPRHDLAF